MSRSKTNQASLTLAALLSLCVLPALAGASERVSFTRADLDNDGFVTFKDVVMGSLYLQGRGRLVVIEALDVINDGVINEGDLFALAHLAASPVPAGFPTRTISYERGDLTNDGRINEADAAALEQLLRRDVPIAGHMDAADVNDDGQINRSDLAALANRIAGDRRVAPTPTKRLNDPGQTKTRTAPTPTKVRTAPTTPTKDRIQAPTKPRDPKSAGGTRVVASRKSVKR